MDMSSMDSSDMSMTMSGVFMNSQVTPLYSAMWTPSTAGGYAGTCIFLILLALTLRALFAAKAILESRWMAQARQRRYVVVRGRNTEAGNIENSSESKEGSLVSANGVEERVKIVSNSSMGTVPFRLSVDVPRAALVFVISGVAYLLMLAVMTMNIGYFFSVLAGTFVGEVAVGRYAVSEAH